MPYARIPAACLMLLWCSSTAASAQDNYPKTLYQGFTPSGGCVCPEDNAFATSRPVKLDPGPCVSDDRSMSPNSWNAPQTPDRIGSQGKQAESAPSVPDLQSNSPFKPTGFARKPQTGPPVQTPAAAPGGQSIVSPNQSRYPLPPSHSRSVLTEPFNSVDNWYDGGKPKNTLIQPEPGSIDNGIALPSSGYSNRAGSQPAYRPDLGHRDASPTIRNRGSYNQGKKYDFEDKKKQYPPMSEILATGRYFGSASVLFMKPAFQANTAITTLGGSVGQSMPFDFDYEGAPQFRLGFESKYGPGIELKYWQYDESSNPASFTSDATTSGSTGTWMIGPGSWSRLSTTASGETIDALHSIDVESIGISFFKEVKLPISRINGTFGLQYLSIEQRMEATLSSGGGVIGTLDSFSELRAFGPRFSLEYYRPVGHTKLEFITSAGGSLMFGRRDQFVNNSLTGDFSLVGADEFVSLLEFMAGVQYKKMTAENRSVFARFGLIYQAMPGGGTAINAQDNFGLHGYSFSVGYNR